MRVKRLCRLSLAMLVMSCASDAETTPPVVNGPPSHCDEIADAAPDAPFARIEPSFDDADPLATRLCDEGATPPAELENPWDLHCQIAAGRGAAVDENAPPPDKLRIVTWNIQFGQDLAGVKAMLDSDPELASADVLLLAEVDRGCTRSGGVDVARELALQRGMDWVFGVEFVEHAQGGCEEGNAVLSRYPLGNPEHRFHNVGGISRGMLHAPFDWSIDPDEPRTGRRSFVGADVRVGSALVRVIAAHFENNSSPEERGAEAQEIIDFVRMLPRRSACIAGDFNPFPDIGDTVIDAPLFDALDAACFVNPHADMPQAERRTRPNLGYQIDFTYLRSLESAAHGVQNTLPEEQLPSDHYPVWVDVVLAAW
jgi:endonuclease/exonuclease/phosphatase family metal-dependent hydrolase